MARARDNAGCLVVNKSGPAASVKYCPFCTKQIEGVNMFVYRKGRSSGRGAGLAWGGPAHHKLAAHIRAAHPEKITVR